MVHALDASLCGHRRRIKIRSNDTDVVVVAISIAGTIPADELWIYGSAKQLRNLPAQYEIATSLGREKSMFHTLSGCDTVSFFSSRGKKTAWDVWNVFPELTGTLQSLTLLPATISKECMAVIERFVVLLYNRTSNLTEVNEARQELFSKKSRSLDSIPPTSASLLQHTKRAVYQGGYVTVVATVPNLIILIVTNTGTCKLKSLGFLTPDREKEATAGEHLA